MNDKTTVETTAKVSARRRLVRGVFAAPAALTLYSGGAIAATSVSCVARQQDPKLVVGDPGTAWVRVPVWILTAAVDRGSNWVFGGDLAALNATSSYLSSTQWQAISVEKNSSFKVKDIVNAKPVQPTSAGGNASPVQSTTTFVAVRIDSTGRIVGVEPIETNQGSALSTSCWTSFGGKLI